MKRIVILLIMSFLFAFSYAQNVAGFQEYFVPGPENDLSAIWSYVEGSYGEFETIITITATSDDTEIKYDHWEDGFSASGNETITLNQGDYYAFSDNSIVIDNDDDNGDGTDDPSFTDGNSSTYNYDGGDRIYVSGGPVFISRASVPDAIMSASWELFPVDAWENDFTVPFGVDLYNSNSTVFHDFDKVALMIMSGSDNNTITFDFPAADAGHTDASIVLDKGENVYYTEVYKGTIVSSTAPIQVQMVIGNYASSGREIRGLSGVPQSKWSTEYYAPIISDRNVDVFLYNPGEAAITINYEDGSYSGSFTIDAEEAISFENKVGHFPNNGARVYSSGSDKFWGIVSVDTRSGIYDWAFDLIPVEYIRTDYRVGWAPGSSASTPTTICNAIFAMALEEDTDIFVDFDGDGTIDKSFNGSSTLDRLDVVMIADENDHNTSGARIWSNDKNIALTYGEIAGSNVYEGGTTPSGSPAMDLGYTILPMPEEWLEPVIQVTASNDQGEEIVANPGEDVTFTIRLDAHDYDLTNVDLAAQLDQGWEFTDNSTTITHYNSDGSVKWSISGDTADPQITGLEDPGYVLTWDISRDVDADEYIVLTYDAHPTFMALEGENEIISETKGTYNSHEFNAYDSEFVTLQGEDFGDEPLLVSLSHFSAASVEGTIVLTWTTESEIENLGFVLQRRELNDPNWATVADYISDLNLCGQGISSEEKDYSYVDDCVQPGVCYKYRLGDVSNGSNGHIAWQAEAILTADPASADLPQEFGLNKIYPNPFNPSAVIEYSIAEEGLCRIQIVDLGGRVIHDLVNGYRAAGNFKSEWTPVNASTGVYIVRLQQNNKSILRKIVYVK